jgi:hypothetical protein
MFMTSVKFSAEKTLSSTGGGGVPSGQSSRIILPQTGIS